MESLSVVVFAAFALVLTVWSWAIQRRHPEATVHELFDRLLEDRTVRVAVIVIWWWLGWHFLAGATL